MVARGWQGKISSELMNLMESRFDLPDLHTRGRQAGALQVLINEFALF
jgi:hypothetical protein